MKTMKGILAVLGTTCAMITATAQSTAQNDTGFVARNIRSHLLSIKIAQLAQQRSDEPGTKSLAREIMTNDRETLKKLLASKKYNTSGPGQQELDRIINDFKADTIYSPLDTAVASTTGNTVTDSLGSGSSGSGNVNGDDTGTIARSRSNKRNAKYSSEGDYLYSNQPAIEALKDLEKSKGKDFDRQWLRYMLGVTDGRLKDFEAQSNNEKDTASRYLAVQALPVIRSEKDMLMQAAKRNKGTGPRDDGRQTPGKSNAGAGSAASPSTGTNNPDKKN